MNLTMDEEAGMMMKYDPYLRKVVGVYMSRNRMPTSGHYEDFLQEARLAMLGHIREMDDEGQIFLCYIHILSAMCRHKERMGLLYIPHMVYSKHQHKFTRASVDQLRNLQEADGDVIFKILLDRFLDTLDPQERKAFIMKVDGYRNQEITRATGLGSDSQTSRYLKRLSEKYRHFTGAEEEDTG